MKRLLMVFVFVIMFYSQAWGAYEKSGIVYYPTDGGSLVDIVTAVTARGEACTIKLLHKSGASTEFEINSELTVPRYVTLEFERGALIFSEYNITLASMPVCDPQSQIFELTGGASILFDKSVQVEITPSMYGGDATGSADSVFAFNDALNSIASSEGGTLIIDGNYRCDSAVTCTNLDGLVIRGVGGSVTNEEEYVSVIDFGQTPAGSNGVVLDGCDGVAVRDLTLTFEGAGNADGVLLYLIDITGGNFSNIYTICGNRSGTVTGLKVGDGTGEGAVIVSEFETIVSQCNYRPFWVAAGNTSLTFQSCYAIGSGSLSGAFAHWDIDSTQYSTWISCAADGSGVSNAYFGYDISSCDTGSFISCGSEGMGGGGFKIKSSTNLTFTSPYGLSNNTSGTTTIGTLFDIGSAGLSSNITIISPRDKTPTYSGTSSVWINATGVAGGIVIIGGEATQLKDGIGGTPSGTIDQYYTQIGSQASQMTTVNITNGLIADEITVDNLYGDDIELSSSYGVVDSTEGGNYIVKKQKVTASSTGSIISLNFSQCSTGDKIIGCLLRVDSALTTTSGTFDANYFSGSAQSIVNGGTNAKNSKYEVFFDVNSATDIATGNMEIVIDDNGAGTCSAGTVTGVLYFAELKELDDEP